MLDFFNDQNKDLLEGIQGNILKPHGRHHTANVFIRGDAGKQLAMKAWLRSLVDGDNAIIQSGYAQLRSNVLWKENRIDTGLFACIHVSAAGYNYLFSNHGRSVDSSFHKGMKSADLNDPSIESWDAGLRVDNHFMLLLASENTGLLKASLALIAETIQLFGSITTIEQGEVQFNDDGAGIEHFGYVDGVSQPLFFEDEWEAYKTDNNIQDPTDIKFDPRAEKELVLAPDPFINDNDPNAFGSYFVFRKLEQNVRGFKQAESDLAHQLGLKGNDKERAGAMLVGRFEDGTPIQLNDEDGAVNSAVLNNFDYNTADASKCPFHAHIRKTNPRSGLDGGMEEAKKHIMARRGIPYGTRADDPNDGQIMNKPERGVGLLFMSYQASISNQFEFIQKTWANNPTSHLNPNEFDGLDPVIGQGGSKYATKWGDSGTLKNAGFGQFVHMKGGDYFFAPSMSFLKNIDTI